MELITFASQEGKDVYRHSTAHVMAHAVKLLFPDVKIAIGPAIEDGFYYDFDRSEPFTPEDLQKIESKMKEIIKKNASFVRRIVRKTDALTLFTQRGEIYKVELINSIPDETVSLYEEDGFIDLCRGPHLPRTGRIKAFKLLHVAGAYWRGDEKNKMLQRIYGTAWSSRQELDAYLKRLAEIEKRDHRRLGKELDLFSIQDEVGPGLILWHPKGARLRHIVESFWRDEHYKNGYELINSPHIGRGNLWQTSGHLDFYSENMYAPMMIDEQAYYVKPMNCPFHIMMFKNRGWSYRDFPVRWAELGTVYRYERSGVLHGLLRVRGFTQDDAHIFCRPDQMPDEIDRVLEFSLFMLRSFGFQDFKVYLATRPVGKSVGDDSMWEAATVALRDAVKRTGISFEIDEGGGAFYGPKIDIKIKDALGRQWQCSTIQFDFNLPDRFDMTYTGSDGKKHRPYMIHRALLGSIERFMGVLIEHFAGAFPVWLSPVQLSILTITERHETFACDVLRQMQKCDIRAELDVDNEKIGFKIRRATLAKIPYLVIIGDREVEEQKITVRKRDGENIGPYAIDEFIGFLKDIIKNKQ